MLKSHFDIAVIKGDGIGPEVIDEGMKILQVIQEVSYIKFNCIYYPFGADHYIKTGEIMPDSVINEFKQMDAIYLGAIGDPRVEIGILERGIVGAIRFKLDLYINLRPIKLYDSFYTPIKNKKEEDIDMIVVRENTEDVYTQIGGFLKKYTQDEVAIQEVVYTKKAVERIIRYAYQLCRKRNKKKRITLCDKANAIFAHDLWRRTFVEIGMEYKDIAQDYAYIDAMCMWLIKKPEYYDTIVTTNMFGDIITDLGAAIEGGVGVAAGGNIHPGKVSMFEPIHGSAPKYKGKNTVNPIGAILALAMLLEHIGLPQYSEKIEKAVEKVIKQKVMKTLGADSSLSTTQIGNLIKDTLKEFL
ncbi:MAG: 3-isopropylmalate dehydrogenase [Planctomycetota bacterium]